MADFVNYTDKIDQVDRIQYITGGVEFPCIVVIGNTLQHIGSF